MALYSYKGLDRSGKEIKATINSDSLNNAKQKIKGMGIMLLDIREQKSQEAKKESSLSFLKKININELSLMTRQLATLIKAKIQIVEALTALIDQTDNQALRVILSEVRQKVNEGASLAKALSSYPKVFDNIYVNMVEAGEASGNLEVVLMRLAEFTEGQVKLKNRVKGAMTYPIIMVLVGAGLMGVIFTFVIPKITKILLSAKVPLPLQTQICIWISHFIKNYWWLIIASVIGGFFLFNRYVATKSGKANWDRLLTKLPVVGTLVVMINIDRFCSTLATLLNSGVPILAAMNIVKNLVSNVHMQNAIEEAKVSIAEGSSMVKPLIKSGLFPSMVTHMISLGEKSGEVQSMLGIISENYKDQVDSKLTGLTSLLEPVMIVCMGLAVAFIVFSVVVPMIEMNAAATKH